MLVAPVLQVKIDDRHPGIAMQTLGRAAVQAHLGRMRHDISRAWRHDILRAWRHDILRSVKNMTKGTLPSSARLLHSCARARLVQRARVASHRVRETTDDYRQSALQQGRAEMAGIENARIPFQEYADDPGSQLGRYVPFETLVTEHDVLTRGGDLIRIWRLDALCSAGAEGPDRSLEQRAAFLSLLQKLAGGRFALWMHRVRRLAQELEPAAARQQRSAGSGRMLDEIYLSVLVRSVPRRLPRFLRIPRKASRSASGCHAELLSVMNEAVQAVESALGELQPHLLGDYFVAGRHYSEVLEFLGLLVNGTWTHHEVTPALLYKSLPRAHVAFAGEQIMFRQGEHTRYALSFGIAQEPPDAGEAFASQRRELRLSQECEFIETRSFAPAFERICDAGVNTHPHERAPGRGNHGPDVAAVAMRSAGLADYHYSLVVFGLVRHSKNPLDAEHRAAAAAYVVGATLGVPVVACDMSDAAWFSQWPGTWSWRARQARLSSRSFAAPSLYQAVSDGE